MTINTGTNSTPLIARQSKDVYGFLVIPIVCIVVSLAVWILLRYIRHLHQKPEWIEAQKKRTTARKDVSSLAQRLSLSHAETELLWNICRIGKAPNIIYLIHSTEAVEALFKNYYQQLRSSRASEESVSALFRLRYKIELSEASSSIITSSTTITEGTKITYIASNGMQISCTLKKNSPDNMILSIPQQFYDSEGKPAPLSKSIFTFVSRTGMHYIFSARIIRYELGLDGLPELALSHTNDLRSQTKRQSKRMTMNIPCMYSAVRIDSKHKGIEYVPLEKQYETVLSNISADGCCILTPLPIKEKQNICVSIPLGDDTYQAVGTIVATRRNQANNTFFLHISFIQIAPKAQNLIFASIYGYNEKQDSPAT